MIFALLEHKVLSAKFHLSVTQSIKSGYISLVCHSVYQKVDIFNLSVTQSIKEWIYLTCLSLSLSKSGYIQLVCHSVYQRVDIFNLSVTQSIKEWILLSSN